jgi:hypothetical protein
LRGDRDPALARLAALALARVAATPDDGMEANG